jgi:hypothetical protein
VITPLSLVALAAAFTVTLVALFAFEDRRGAVFLPRVRAACDTVVTELSVRIARMVHHVATGSVRLLFHYLMHRALSLLTRIFARTSHYFEQLKRRNRTIARTVQKERFDSHLGQVAAHKKEQALTKREREALRERSLEGK